MSKMKTLHKKKLLIGSMFIILFFSAILLIPVAADDVDDLTDDLVDDDDDGVGDEEEELNERELHVDVSDTEIQIESQLKTGEVKNEFSIKIKTEEEGLTFKLEYNEDIGNTEFELEFKVKIQEIVEYIDTTADGFYNASLDTEKQIYEFDFLPMVYAVDDTGNTPIHTIDISTTDGVFTSSIYFATEFALIDGVIVAPTQIKIDVGIHDFPYLDDNSDLALKVKLESTADYEEDDITEDEEDGRATDEREVEISKGDAEGFFSWVETALIDGVEQVVKATPLEIENEEQKLYLNYPRGQEIIHDPKVGMSNILLDTLGISIGIALPILSRNGYLIVTAISALVIVSMIVFALRRKPKTN